jgi:hypothetical protein
MGYYKRLAPFTSPIVFHGTVERGLNQNYITYILRNAIGDTAESRKRWYDQAVGDARNVNKYLEFLDEQMEIVPALEEELKARESDIF